MNKKLKVFLGVAASIMALVAALVLFAPMFDIAYSETEDYTNKVFGSCFQVMFYGGASEVSGSKAVGLLIAGFVAECVAFIGGFVTAGGNKKVSTISSIINAVLLVFAGVVFLLGRPIYEGVYGEFNNPQVAQYLVISTGAICSVVFAFIGALLHAYNVYTIVKD